MTAQPEVLFYHLERQTLEQALPKLLEMSLQRDWKVVVQAGSEERVAALGKHLWVYDERSFLPHGSAVDSSTESAVDQPIWLTVKEETPNEADILFLVDGAERENITGFTRCIYIFDGGDEVALQNARTHWQKVKEQGYSTTYYQQSPAGKWEKQG